MNMNLAWNFKSFEELTLPELYEILKLRVEVFIIEQQCFYQDLDGKDQKSHHLYLKDEETEEIIAYLRLVEPDISFPEPSIGRVIVKENSRNQQLGSILMQKGIEIARIHYKSSTGIRISAQAHLQNFYQTLGFESEGEVYKEDDIDHIQMILKF